MWQNTATWSRTVQCGRTRLIYAVHQTLPFLQKWVWLARLIRFSHSSSDLPKESAEGLASLIPMPLLYSLIPMPLLYNLIPIPLLYRLIPMPLLYRLIPMPLLHSLIPMLLLYSLIPKLFIWEPFLWQMTWEQGWGIAQLQHLSLLVSHSTQPVKSRTSLISSHSWINPACEHSLELKKITPLSNSSCTVTQPHLIAGNEDDLDNSDRLSSWSVLMHCTALYIPSICAIHFDSACTTGAHARLYWT